MAAAERDRSFEIARLDERPDEGTFDRRTVVQGTGQGARHRLRPEAESWHARRMNATRLLLVVPALVTTACLGYPHQQEPARQRSPDGPAAVEDSTGLAGVVNSVLASDPRFEALAADPAAHRLQVLVSRVVEGQDGAPTLERHGYRVDAEYVYPASAVKTCAAVAAVLELEARDLSLDAPLVLHPLFDDEERDEGDTSNLAGGAITVRHELRKLFLVSGNRAYNRLYELTGHRELNEAMWSAGLGATRLNHRLSEFRSVEDQRRTPQVDVLAMDGSGDVVHTFDARDSDLVLVHDDVPATDLGVGFARGGEVDPGPTSFARKNWMSLVDLQDLNVLLVRPDIDLGVPGFDLTEEGRRTIVEAMSEYPPDSTNPVYDPATYPRNWGVFLLDGLERVVPPEHLLVANKLGRAYGFSVENAYVEDRRSGAAFFVTAVLWTNRNGVLNDGAYEYAEVADPFLEQLGEELARAYLVSDER